MKVEAEVSLYLLGKEHLGPGIEAFVNLLKDHGCETEVGQMSTIVKGESRQVFEALRMGYEKAAQEGGCVLIIKASNACPV